MFQDVLLAATLDAKQQIEETLLKIPGVTAVDVGYKYVNGVATSELSIRVHVEKKKKSVPEKEKIPTEINGIKTDVIEGTYELHSVSAVVAELRPQADATRYRPVIGGTSIGPNRAIGGRVYTGTLGCMVKDNVTGKHLMLSNFHVMCVDNTWSVGDQMNQPSRVDGGTAADNVGRLVRAVLSSKVDGAVASVKTGILTECKIAEIGAVKGTNNATLGMAVRKRGRTTGLSYGFIDGLSVSVNINYGTGIGVRTLRNQISIVPDTSKNPSFSASGDSGSAIVDNGNKVVGLLFGGNEVRTIANFIGDVERELNVKVCKHVVIKAKEIGDKLPSEGKYPIKEIGDKLPFEGKHPIKEIGDKLPFEGKHPIKEIGDKNPKEIFENPKGFLENPRLPNDPRVPIDLSPIIRNLEDKIAELSQTVGALNVFISQSLRPELYNGDLDDDDDYDNEDDI